MITESRPAIANLDDERLIRDGEAAVQRCLQRDADARRDIMPMARGLRAARRKYPADREFGAWLRQSPYNDVIPEYRAALINIGEHEPHFELIVLQTRFSSPRAIWESGAKLLSLSPSTPPVLIQSIPTREVGMATNVHPDAPQEPREATTGSAETDPVTQRHEKGKSRHALIARRGGGGKKSPLVGQPDGDLLLDHFLADNARATLGKLVNGTRAEKQALALIAESIKSGSFGPPTMAGSAKAILRMAFPWLHPRKPFSCQLLTAPHIAELAREHIIPLVVEDPSLKHPNQTDQVQRLANKRRVEMEKKERERLKAEQRERQLANLPTGEQEIVAYGDPLWPPPEGLGPRFTYDELRHACWYADYLMGIAPRDRNPSSVAITARHLTKYFEPFCPGFMRAVQAIFNAYEINPDGEKRFPVVPVNAFS